MSPASGELFRTMIVRISPDDIVFYANAAMAAYLRTSKPKLIGSPLEVLAKRVSGEIAGCFQRPEAGKISHRLVTDTTGRVFEVKTYSEGGVLDIVLDEVTTPELIARDLRHASGTPVDTLNEEELRTTRQPEIRFMSVSHSSLTGLAHLAEHLAPMEVRLMVNSFVEEASDAVLESGCSVYRASGESVVGLFGAPRHFADHALRAVRSACAQVEKSTRLRAGFSRQGKEMPPMSCGIWTGETFIGTLGSSTDLQYAALGQPVDMAAELCRLARPGEVLVSDFTLRELVKHLPSGWQAVRAESEAEPDLSDFHWKSEDIVPVPAENSRGVWLIGPGIEDDASRAEFYMDYLWAIKVPGFDEPVSILRAVRPTLIGDSLELSEENVVTQKIAQTLGKYKLISLIGEGGMGKVWKAQDRYGNIVAIKVLHSSEAASESQLKRFRREAEIMGRLPHRNICRIFEMNEFEDIHYIVMEYVDGLTLADLLYEQTIAESSGEKHTPYADLEALIHAIRADASTRSENTSESRVEPPPRRKDTRILPIAQSLSLFLKICEAVQFAHEHGVLHRDLKPGNILLREDGEPLVADFGLAKLESADGPSLSISGHVVGTLENMSPEQAVSSKDVDERADVYSLGTILYQMLTGRRHFKATGNLVVDAQALQEHMPARPRGLNPHIDSDLEIIVLKSLRNLPDERYRNVTALKADIEHYRRGEVIAARPVTALELFRKLVQRNRTVTAVIVASLFLLLAGSVVAFWQIADLAKKAVAQRDAAEEQRKIAEEARDDAEVQRKIAEEKQELADQSAKEAREALARVATEKGLRTDAEGKMTHAQGETEKERAAREDAERKAGASEEDLLKTREELERLKSLPPPPPPKDKKLIARDDAVSKEAQRALEQAMIHFHTQLNQGEIARYDRNPEMVLGRVETGMETISRALLGDPSRSAAWTMKGRYHLVCLEMSQAAASFRMAVRMAADTGEETKDMVFAGRPAPLLDICNQLEKPTHDRPAKAVELIRSLGTPTDTITAGVIGFFKDKPLPKKSNLGTNPTGRALSSAELASGVILENDGKGRIIFNDGAAGKDITISGIEELTNLGALKNLSPKKIKIEGARTLDWVSLTGLPLESLDLTGCPLSAFPASLRSFPRLGTLTLRDTKIPDLGFVRVVPGLMILDIAGTSVSDLTPLGVYRRLQSLDASALALSNLRVLSNLPLVRLTISPLMISDKDALNSLRTHRTLRILRAPDDPENQSPSDFWQKLDAGYYDVAREE